MDNANQQLISLNNLIENEREILSKLQRIGNPINYLLNQIGDVEWQYKVKSKGRENP